ncbi:MAG: enoyl-CoA hydratase/isomerase family protein, partial [Phycisphaerae bacterium]|nr:enoyl-CoA hydratase/isomerase family protein [Phycisphaerae bacterium]
MQRAATELVLTTVADGVATITLNRGDKANALSRELINAMADAVAAVARRCGPSAATAATGAQHAESPNHDVRVVVLAGAGKCFCAGMDLRAVANDPVAMGDMLRTLSRVSRAIRRLPVPTISQVQGAAVGGGCGLMVVTDFAVTHPESKVGYPEVDLGVCPAVVAPWLIRKIGAGRARAMLLAGGTMTGREGFDLGLATHLCEQSALETTVRDLAARLAKGGPNAIAATKHWLNELDGSLDDAVLDKAAELSAQIIAGDEAQTRL